MQAEADPAVAILRLIRSLERRQRFAAAPPLLSLDDLVDRLGLERGRCRRALAELVRRGTLRAQRHPTGRLQLWTAL